MKLNRPRKILLLVHTVDPVSPTETEEKVVPLRYSSPKDPVYTKSSAKPQVQNKVLTL